MSKQSIYERAEQRGCYLESTCVGCGMAYWEKTMKGAVRADTRKVHKIAKSLGIVPEGFTAENNPYHQLKTKTHIIYVHSSIEHFIKVN